MLKVIRGLAHFEDEMTQALTTAGRARAKARVKASAARISLPSTSGEKFCSAGRQVSPCGRSRAATQRARALFLD